MSPSLKFLGRIPVENLSAAMTLVSLDSPLWVREHMFSAVHPITDITKLERHVRKVP
jgi:hypothetical protein